MSESPQTTPSRLTWFCLGGAITSLINIFGHGPERASLNISAWGVPAWLGWWAWYMSLPVLLAIVIAIMSRKVFR